MATGATGTPTTTHSIPKILTSVDNPSGVGHNSAMDALDALLNSRVAVVGAAATLSKSIKVQGDTQPRWTVDGSGKISWGAGGVSAIDTSFYRKSGTILGTDGSIRVGFDLSANATTSGGWTANSVVIGHDGGAPAPQIGFGSFADTYIKMLGTKILASNSTLVSTRNDGAAGFQFNPSIATGYALFSSIGSATVQSYSINHIGIHQWGPGGSTAVDTSLYRGGAATLNTDGDFIAKGFLQGGSLRSAGNYGMVLSASGDTGLRLMILNDGKLTWGSGSGFSGDTSLYRVAAKALKTDGVFSADTSYSGAGTMGGLITSSKAGIPVDADMQVPANNALIVDTTNSRLYVRVAGTWKYAALT